MSLIKGQSVGAEVPVHLLPAELYQLKAKDLRNVCRSVRVSVDKWANKPEMLAALVAASASTVNQASASMDQSSAPSSGSASAQSLVTTAHLSAVQVEQIVRSYAGTAQVRRGKQLQYKALYELDHSIAATRLELLRAVLRARGGNLKRKQPTQGLAPAGKAEASADATTGVKRRKSFSDADENMMSIADGNVPSTSLHSPSHPLVMGFENHPKQSLCYMTAPLLGVALGTNYLSQLLLYAIRRRLSSIKSKGRSKKSASISLAQATELKQSARGSVHALRGGGGGAGVASPVASPLSSPSASPVRTPGMPSDSSGWSAASKHTADMTVSTCLTMIPSFFDRLYTQWPAPLIPISDMQRFRNAFRVSARWHLDEQPSEQQDSLDFVRALLGLTEAAPFFVLVRDTLHSMIPDEDDRNLTEPQHELVLDNVASRKEPTTLATLIFGVMEKQIRQVKRMDMWLPRGTRNSPAAPAEGHALQQRRFLQCPNVLLVSLLRFQLNNKGRKERVSREVSVPTVLTHKELPGLKPTDSVELRMAVCHHTKGKSVGGGHYTVFYRHNSMVSELPRFVSIVDPTADAQSSSSSSAVAAAADHDSKTDPDTQVSDHHPVADGWYWFDDLGHGMTRKSTSTRPTMGSPLPSVRLCSWAYVSARLLRDGYYFVYERVDSATRSPSGAGSSSGAAMGPKTAPRPSRVAGASVLAAGPGAAGAVGNASVADSGVGSNKRMLDMQASPPPRLSRTLAIPDTV